MAAFISAGRKGVSANGAGFQWHEDICWITGNAVISLSDKLVPIWVFANMMRTTVVFHKPAISGIAH